MSSYRALTSGRHASSCFFLCLLAGALAASAAAPRLDRARAAHVLAQRLARIDGARSTGRPACAAIRAHAVPALGDGALASWQTIGGCGAGASTGTGGGIKWIGRGVSGGLLNTQCLASYTRVDSPLGHAEHHGFGNAIVTTGLGDRWQLGVNVPLVVKYLQNPFETGLDLSNSGMGDVSALLSGRLGPIGATIVTATVGFPTGQFDGRYMRRILNHNQQRGFGKRTASLMLDHVGDEVWGLTVVGLSAAWRGGENSLNSYRAPSASTYGYAGFFLGPFVPAFGLTLTGLSGHDRDLTVEQMSGLFVAAPSVSIEWSTDWVAVLVGGSLPYQYDGFYQDTEGQPRSPWGFGPWTVGIGFAFSPF